MKPEGIIKSSEEQAVASWVNYLNQVRLDKMAIALNAESQNLENALLSVTDAFNRIQNEIINNGMGRGGAKGMHGYIAEAAQYGIENARNLIKGEDAIVKWIDDNGPTDLMRGSLEIQQKFVNAGGHLSLEAVRKHLEKYPDYLKDGHKYQIPADHYRKIKELLTIPEQEANKLATSTGEFSLRQWNEVHDFVDNVLPMDKIEPSVLEYKDVQQNTIADTIDKEKQALTKTNQERKAIIEQKSAPSYSEGAKATVVAAVAESAVSVCVNIHSKLNEGKKITDFNADDWYEIGGEAGKAALKGGVRGISLYTLTNVASTPAGVANAMVTASFGIAEQAHLFRNGKLSETEFIENSQVLCLDASVSALSSFIGQAIIPVPVIGAVLGNAIGTTLYQISKDNLNSLEQRLVEQHLQSINEFNKTLDAQYYIVLQNINETIVQFYSILEKAFSPDVSVAFEGSIQLAKEMGVPIEEILDSKSKIDDYFLL